MLVPCGEAGLPRPAGAQTGGQAEGYSPGMAPALGCRLGWLTVGLEMPGEGGLCPQGTTHQTGCRGTVGLLTLGGERAPRAPGDTEHLLEGLCTSARAPHTRLPWLDPHFQAHALGGWPARAAWAGLLVPACLLAWLPRPSWALGHMTSPPEGSAGYSRGAAGSSAEAGQALVTEPSNQDRCGGQAGHSPLSWAPWGGQWGGSWVASQRHLLFRHRPVSPHENP